MDDNYYKYIDYENLPMFLDTLTGDIDNITITDGKGVFTNVKNSCEKFFGVEAKEFIGKRASYLENCGVFDKSVTVQVLKSRQRVKLVQLTKSNRTLEVTGFPFFNSDGELTNIVNVTKDLTFSNSKEFKETNPVELFAYDPISIQMKAMIDLVASYDCMVLLLGNTGCGKTHIARYMHERSLRKDQPFLEINCGAIPENLIESELFGYEKGSLTGGLKDGKAGVFELARGGTILLDEIGELRLDLQVKLLQVLDTLSVYRIGSVTPTKVSARIILATNKNLLEMVKNGKFRKDLYYRINMMSILVPDLNERKQDILPLAKFFLQKLNVKYDKNAKITEEFKDFLTSYYYNGNIRELINIMERYVLFYGTDFRDVINSGIYAYKIDDSNFGLEDNIEVKALMSLDKAKEELERQLIMLAKEKYDTVREIAKALGVNPSTISRKMNKYD